GAIHTAGARQSISESANSQFSSTASHTEILTAPDVTYDAANRIISYTHLSANDGIAQPSLDQNFNYDENGRLTQVTTVASSWSITYDANGNRTGVSLNGSPSVYTTSATSNRLTSITNPARSFGYDNAGNTTSDSTNYTATYGLSGSLASITKAGVTGTYTYDASKRRIRKVTSAGAGSTVIFVYGLNGELLGEYDQNGAALREYIWLDETPVAMFMPDPSKPSGAPQAFYVHADHLNASRLVVDMNNATRWRWFAEPFGTTAPEVNPSGLGAYTQNLRFPGQYADVESGLFYNYFRYYAPEGGAYRQSDPMGLAGGGRSTYSYVGGTPVNATDSKGLRWDCKVIGGALGFQCVNVPDWPAGDPFDLPVSPPPSVSPTVPLPNSDPVGALCQANPLLCLAIGYVNYKLCPQQPDCEAERRACIQTCAEALADGTGQRDNIAHGGFDACVVGCIPEECGGSPKENGYPPKKPKRRYF
ncbi:RHS repeat domain-containing protein, partial [Rhizobacter sp. Root16D2]